jgi:hypothetical protein
MSVRGKTRIVARVIILGSFPDASDAMPVSVMPVWIGGCRRAPELLRCSVVIGRFVVLIALTWAVFASLTISASHACAGRDSAARLIGASVSGTSAPQPMIGEIDSDSAGLGSVHHSCCTGGCCSTCSLGLDSTVTPLFEPSGARIEFSYLHESSKPVDRRPDLRPPNLRLTSRPRKRGLVSVGNTRGLASGSKWTQFPM